MDYEKKYKEAQKWIESIYSELSHEQQMEAEAFFPELEESEDERIRKEIIATIHLYYGEPLEDEAKEMIAWLEKQGDKKTTDKVESKFKVGDWIIRNNEYTGVPIQVIEFKGYYRCNLNGEVVTLTPNDVHNNFHRWTIQDAKDGDVLVSPPIKGQEGKEQIFIFKGINSRDYVDNCIEYYCRVYEGVFYENENGNGYMGTTSSPLYPATKEQRDLLFQKMKEAGYEWDAEKKELKKIEQKSYARHKVGDTIYYDSFGRLVSFTIANIVEDGTDNPMYEDKDGNSVFQNDIVEQKPTEEYNITGIGSKHATGKLKEILEKKENPAWSEEDEEILRTIISDGLRGAEFDMLQINWLKSLKQRIGWKPSEEQIECLYDAVKHYQTNGYPASKLNELYEQMSKIYKL